MLKAQLHTHVKGDLLDKIPYSPKDLIKKAAQLNYEILSITCHKKIIFNKELKRFAKKLNILLIPGIELEIDKKHILLINATKSAEKINSFEKLKTYKKNHPNSLIVAPHPFFPGRVSLKKALTEHIKLFDAIEYSHCYTKTKNYNTPSVALAKTHSLPLIATSDCHFLPNLDTAYTLINSQKNTNSIIKAIKQNSITLHHSPTTYSKIAKNLCGQILRNTLHKR
ncbi:MAG: PHP-associated domain-containing protein [Candidatus Peregrinibacteria bacterium]